MKKLVFIISLFLSVAVLSADIKDLTKGSDLDQAYRKKWESTHNNGEGGPEFIQYQSVDGVIYDQHGKRYTLEGTFKYPDGQGNIIEKDCAGTELITDPQYDWGENWHKYLAGLIASPECKKVPKKWAPDNISSQSKTLLDYGKQSLYSCNCTSASIDCGPSAVCNIGGCNSTDECLSSGSELCLGLCKSIDIDPR